VACVSGFLTKIVPSSEVEVEQPVVRWTGSVKLEPRPEGPALAHGKALVLRRMSQLVNFVLDSILCLC